MPPPLGGIHVQGPPPVAPIPPIPQNHVPPPVVRPNGPVPDRRSMEELCQPSINGRGGPIAMILIQAVDFGLRHHMIQQASGHHQCCSRRNFMQKTPEECYELIENMTAHHKHWDTSATRDETSRTIASATTTESPEVVRQLEMMNKNFQDMMRQIQSVKSVSPKCETCGGSHSFTECPAVGGYTQETAYATTVNHNSGGNSYQPQGDRNMLSYRSNNYLGPPGFNQPNVQNRYNQNQGHNQNQGSYQALNNQVQASSSNELSNYMKVNETNMRAMQNQITAIKLEMKNDFETSMVKQSNELKNIMASFF
ncbi:hypothetical protein Tco_0800606 [Tanacetum coccineum]|uniref:Reverse transcriptase domain-containing protein n=1 Tax=Tanacetum coccineum TaxID=301880 RepID=A0ABQ4ZY11_9ASTR